MRSINIFGFRKGTMLLLPIVIGFIIGLGVFFFILAKGESEKSSAFVGENSLILMNTYERAKQHLLFIDSAAKFSSEKAVLSLAGNAGFENVSDCGSWLGYNMYYDTNETCFPSRFDSGFSFFLNDLLDDYFSSYKKAFLTKDNYQVSLLQDDDTLEVVGFANRFLEFQIFSKDASFSGGDICPIPADLQSIEGVACYTSYSSCELNKEVVDSLRSAQSIAKAKGYDLLVTSAHRTYQQQGILFNMYGPGRASYPSCGSPHIGGRAVDVVLTKNGVPVEGMSSDQGAMNDLSIGKRSELQNIMCQAGFQRFSGEFWHFEYKTFRWDDPSNGRCVLA